MLTKYMLASGVIGVLLSACSSDPPPAQGYSEIADGLAKPTGTLEADNTREVAEEFGKLRGLGAKGTRPQASGTTTTISCGVSGTYSIEATATNQSSAHAVLTYDACCYLADCCYDGHGDWYYATTGGAQFSYCGTYDVTLDCYGSTAKLAYSGCFDASGTGTYLVTVASFTFAVSGSYSNGSGTVNIKAVNGSWTCTLTPTSGKCTGSSTFTI